MGPNESPSLFHRKQRLQRVFITIMFALLVASITDLHTFSGSLDEYTIDSEKIASQTIVAAFAFDAESLDATREKKELAAAQVPNTWSIDTQRVDDSLSTLQLRITSLSGRSETMKEAITQALLNSTSDEGAEELVMETVRTVVTDWTQNDLAKGFPSADDLIAWFTPDLTTLPNRTFEIDDEANPNAKRKVEELEQADDRGIEFRNLQPLTDLATEGLRYILTAGVMQEGRAQNAKSPHASDQLIIERSRVLRELAVYEVRAIESMPDAQQASTLLSDYINTLTKEFQGSYESTYSDWDLFERAAFSMAKLSLTDTLIFDDARTEVEREKARQQTEPVMKNILAAQKIQEGNEPWTDQTRQDVKTYWETRRSLSGQTSNVLGPIAANMVFVALLLMALQRAIGILETKRFHAFKSMNVILLIIAGTVILGRVMLVFDTTGLLIPVTASAVLLSILTNTRLASVASLLIAAMLSIQYGQDWRLFMLTAAMSLTGIISIYRVRKRQDITTAVLKATFIGFLFVLATTLSTETWIGMEILYSLAAVALNGLVCSLIIPGLLPPLEKLFGITTDIQLLEYSDLNNEVLNRLAIKVPATYAHSLMMGQLAETACDAIGANGLLARVCAYYHDIGKLRRPEYFSENQTGYNIHDDLSPRLSARAIASHVTEGVELAREFHLPQPIIRGILEHHGNSLISFFYSQALEQQKHGDVREEDFRYPGPKPQSRETAILMICDAVESGVRTIKNPNEDRVRDFIDKIIQARSSDRQFDECDLTLKQLDLIGKVLTKLVLSTHHSRVSYPEKPVQEDVTNVIRLSTGGRN